MVQRFSLICAVCCLFSCYGEQARHLPGEKTSLPTLTKHRSEPHYVFLVDFSGSMRETDPLRPDNSCKRADAVQAAAKEAVSPGHFLALGFSYGIDYSKAWMTQDANTINYSEMCGFSGGTDYQAAFIFTSQIGFDSSAPARVVLISDGLPDVRDRDKELGISAEDSLNRTRLKGLSASKELRDINQNLKIFAVFIEPLDPSLAYHDVEGYLEKVTGEKSRVHNYKNQRDYEVFVRSTIYSEEPR